MPLYCTFPCCVFSLKWRESPQGKLLTLNKKKQQKHILKQNRQTGFPPEKNILFHRLVTTVSSFRNTERPSWTLRPCLKAPTAPGWAPGRRGAVHCAKIPLSITIGDKSVPIRPHESALSQHFLAPQEGCGTTAREGLPEVGFGWTMVKSAVRSCLPSHNFCGMTAELGIG